MHVLILYATKYGAAREIAQRISIHIDGAAVHDLKQGDPPALAGFDCVIIGSSLYAGSIRKEVKAFLAQHAAQLRDKKIGLFLSGMAPSDAKKYFADNFPADILQAAKATELLGGIFDPQKAGRMERIIMKVAAKQSEYTNTISDEKIKRFVELMKA